jgi:hypothetical protein
MLLDGELQKNEWLYLRYVGLLTSNEIACLLQQPRRSTSLVVFAWGTMVLKKARDEKFLTDLERNELMKDLSTTRTLSSKQQAYQETSIPKPWFDTFSLLVHTWLMQLTWAAALAGYDDPHRFVTAVAILGNFLVRCGVILYMQLKHSTMLLTFRMAFIGGLYFYGDVVCDSGKYFLFRCQSSKALSIYMNSDDDGPSWGRCHGL